MSEISMNELLLVYEEEIKKNVKNKRKIMNFEKQKIAYLCDIKNLLENNKYDGGKYNIFLINKPKVRVIMAQNIYDKIINHYATRFILMPKFNKYLSNRNCATRKNMGTSYAIKLLKNDIEYFKKYDEFYFLKFDIKKFFYNIDHNVLKKKLSGVLNDFEYNLICQILDSTNHSYINEKIKLYESKLNIALPKYLKDKGLPIGNMTSQYLAILYLSDLHHFITHDLNLKFINYMDDYIILSKDKDKLKNALKIIEQKLNKEYKLELNYDKTYIKKSSIGISFLGYRFKVIDKKNIIKIGTNAKKNIRKGIKRNNFLYKNNKIMFKSYFSSIECLKNSYIFANKNEINNIIERVISM